MPTYAWVAQFRADYDGLSQAQQAMFLIAVSQFATDLQRGGKFRKGLRVKGIKGAAGVFEMTWSDDGRATFEYGDSVIGGEAHIVWRRVGSHTIFAQP